MKVQLPWEQVLLHLLHTGLNSLLRSAAPSMCNKFMMAKQHGSFQHETCPTSNDKSKSQYYMITYVCI